ncbi:phosphotransferase family protein [Phytohabitans sp. ZYX-F-186]|uniref:Phosphotransferase family protein n=1 Tax=Phytohabitans maris TaxID=3071409 RepID=A0ABU0ZPW5_9ACTN|nr:phosphotransferase family protein [Phytohabitans sp. ZYX-F-186]MDQ7909073.1 phosphotransferase family protein [Phytohabitans sp. ZYX-F-186]
MEFDTSATAHLAAWFAGNGIALDGPPRLTLIAGGRSNLTYRVADGTGDRYVLRRPPTGGVLQSAHDVGREYRIITGLATTDVPVPVAHGLCTDETVLGAPFYVMSLVPGTVLAGDEDGAGYPLRARRGASADLVRVLTAIQRVDVDAVGLGDLGRRDSYGARQLRRWLRQFHLTTRRRLPLVEELHDQLERTIPPQRFTGLVHGDFRPGNVLLSPDGHINAVLDWELATLGDTLADLGWLVATWRQPGEAELLESPTAHPGFASREELVAAYQAGTGRDVSDLPWYQAFALWRLACIFEGIFVRYSTGVMGDDGVDPAAEGERVVRLAEAAREAFARLG